MDVYGIYSTYNELVTGVYFNKVRTVGGPTLYVFTIQYINIEWAWIGAFFDISPVHTSYTVPHGQNYLYVWGGKNNTHQKATSMLNLPNLPDRWLASPIRTKLCPSSSSMLLCK